LLSPASAAILPSYSRPSRTGPHGRAIPRVLDRRSTRRQTTNAAGTKGWLRRGRTKGLTDKERRVSPAGSPTQCSEEAILFGAGIGNATSLPPLIAQVEFVREDVPRAVPLMVAIAQASYAFAPAAFGFIRECAPQWSSTSAGAAPWLFVTT